LNKNNPKVKNVNDNLRFEFIQDIRYLFASILRPFNPQRHMVATWLTNCYKKNHFSAISSQPRDMPKSLDKMSIFYGNNVITVENHWDDFIDFI